MPREKLRNGKRCAQRLYGGVKTSPFHPGTCISTFNRPSGTFQFSRFRVPFVPQGEPALCFAACQANYNRASSAEVLKMATKIGRKAKTPARGQRYKRRHAAREAAHPPPALVGLACCATPTLRLGLISELV